jgi:hypothetical protein
MRNYMIAHFVRRSVSPRQELAARWGDTDHRAPIHSRVLDETALVRIFPHGKPRARRALGFQHLVVRPSFPRQPVKQVAQQRIDCFGHLVLPQCAATASAVDLADQPGPAIQHGQCLVRLFGWQANADANRAEVAVALQQIRILAHVEQRHRA